MYRDDELSPEVAKRIRGMSHSALLEMLAAPSAGYTSAALEAAHAELERRGGAGAVQNLAVQDEERADDRSRHDAVDRQRHEAIPKAIVWCALGILLLVGSAMGLASTWQTPMQEFAIPGVIAVVTLRDGKEVDRDPGGAYREKAKTMALLAFVGVAGGLCVAKGLVSLRQRRAGSA